ncbi:hypothetical protein DFH06DRAFT_1424678 [Mycena polygramma]|nr:hypothetical protein DFH06DRAFT_1424678 [Mycena polygramma]
MRCAVRCRCRWWAGVSVGIGGHRGRTAHHPTSPPAGGNDAALPTPTPTPPALACAVLALGSPALSLGSRVRPTCARAFRCSDGTSTSSISTSWTRALPLPVTPSCPPPSTPCSPRPSAPCPCSCPPCSNSSSSPSRPPRLRVSACASSSATSTNCAANPGGITTDRANAGCGRAVPVATSDWR